MSPIRTTLAFAILSLSLVACSEESTAPVEGQSAPELPPPATMQMKLGFFADGAGREQLDPSSAESAARWNWITAVIHVTALHLIIGEVLEPPAAAFELALSAEPERVDENTYIWEYVWEEGAESAAIELEGSWVPGGVDWALRVTGDVDGRTLERALWYSGHSSLTGRSGYWVFTDLEDDASDVARLEWTVALGANELQLEIIDPGHEDFGDHVAYREDGQTRTVEWTDSSEDLLSFVTWNELTGVGSLQVPGHNEGERACWDEDQQDAPCPGGGVSF